jgi:hypothetical protein
MKPLLRAVLVINALIFLAFGVLFLLTPWAALYSALQLVQMQPAFAGQLFGIALIGLSWLAFHAAVDGALTATAAKVSGHVEWLSGVVLLVWLLGLRTPQLESFGQIVSALAGVVLLILGLGSVRLAGAVRRRERAVLAGAASAGRAEKRAAQKRDELRAAPPVPPASTAYRDDRGEPGVVPVAAGRRVDPLAGEPVAGEALDVASRPAARAPNATAIDPVTGRAIDPATGRTLDPLARDRATGATFDPATGRTIDPATGRVVEPAIARSIDPATGRTIDPVTGRVVEPSIARNIDPATGRRIDPVIDPATGHTVDPVTGERVEPRLGADPLRPDTR